MDVVLALHRGTDPDAAFVGELGRVAHNVLQDLPVSQGVALHRLGELGV